MKLQMMTLAALAAGMASAVEISVTRADERWLFGGLGFQNSEANFEAVMSDEFRDQYVLKTFAEISPSFSRTITARIDASKAQLDRWADWYDKTFRRADTTLYVYPCCVPSDPDLLDKDDYAEKVTKNLVYLVHDRGCKKIRYYCLTNELMTEGGGRWFFSRMDEFKAFNVALWKAFQRHGLDVRLLATDIGESWPFGISQSIDWAAKNMGQYVGAYDGHWYLWTRNLRDYTLWDHFNDRMAEFVAISRGGGRRFILGEFGIDPHYRKDMSVMMDDRCYNVARPDLAVDNALLKCEMSMAAVRRGVYAAASWSFVDYPDPFFQEPSDDPKKQAVYEAGKCGWNTDFKYNKWGCFRWNQYDRDYRAYPELYAMGHLVRLFRKGAMVLDCTSDFERAYRASQPSVREPVPCPDPALPRVCAIQNEDGSVTVAVINRGEDNRPVTVDCPWFKKPVRRYDFVGAKVPDNPFNDLQAHSETLAVKDGKVSFAMAHDALALLTTDYEDAAPAAVEGVRRDGDRLVWTATEDPNHRYYRVFRDGKQVASTVATSLKVEAGGDYTVRSVDRWLNVGR